MEHFRLFIDGEFVEAESGARRPSLDPGNGQPVATVAWAGVRDADRAVMAARRAFDKGDWSGLAPKDRSRFLFDLADRLGKMALRIIQYECQDSGATVRRIGGEVLVTSVVIRDLAWYAAEKFAWREEVRLSSFIPTPCRDYVVREPVGVCAGIAPWNAPFSMAILKIVPAVIMGNAVVLKTASDTPISALLLAEAVAASGIPKGVVNVITGPGPEVGEALCRHPGVDRISFTGSTEVGRRILEMGADSVKRVTVELGGKSAGIVLPDADLDIAVDGSVFGIFLHSGQVCAAASRLLVHRDVYEPFVERLKARIPALKLGYQLNPEVHMGPLISERQRERVERYVEIGRREGARLVCGGRRPEGQEFSSGFYYEPTVFADVDNRMTIAREEIFGPVACVIPFASDEEALRFANDSDYGLVGAVWSRDTARAERIAARIRAGTVWVNDWNAFNQFTPFGGYKRSGLGREFGHEGLAAYTEVKHLHVSGVADKESRVTYQLMFDYPASKAFQFQSPTRIDVGPGAVQNIGSEMFQLGCRRAVILSDKGVRDAGLVDVVQKAVGDSCAGVFDGCEEDPSFESVDRAAEFCRKAGADCLISLGGGSCIDTAKSVSVILTVGGRALDHIFASRLEGPVTPHIAVPTTAGTGSEVTCGAILTHRKLGRKLGFMDKAVFPRAAILDPVLTRTLPRGLTVGSGMDALSHAIEAILSKLRNPVAEAHGLHAIRLIVENLPRAAEHPDDLDARLNMQIASSMAGIAVCSAGAGVGHAMAHTLGALYHVHHGTGCGICLPVAMRYNKEVCAPELARVAQALGVDTRGLTENEAADSAVTEVEGFMQRIGHPIRMSEVGVDETDYVVLALECMLEFCCLLNARPVTNPLEVAHMFQAVA
ncbi:MAG: aldehyde dehydrogenase family protein [bacterium]